MWIDGEGAKRISNVSKHSRWRNGGGGGRKQLQIRQSRHIGMRRAPLEVGDDVVDGLGLCNVLLLVSHKGGNQLPRVHA